MEELRDGNATDSSVRNKGEDNALILSPSTSSIIRDLYPDLTVVEKSDDTLIPSDDDTIAPKSSSTLIVAEFVDAGATSTSRRKRSYSASQELDGGNVNVSSTARLAKNDLGKHQKEIEQEINKLPDADATSEPASKKQRSNETKKATTKTKSSSWMRFLKQIPNLSEPKNFPQWLRQLKGPESDEDILEKVASKPEFLISDKTLDTLWSVKGFKEKVCKKLCHEQSDEIIKQIPASKICEYVCQVFKQTTIPKKDSQ